MAPEVIASIIGGSFLLLSTIASIIAAITTKRTSASVRTEGKKLSKRLDEATKVIYIEGERDSHDELTKLTLNENYRVNVTRFGPKSVQRQERYFSGIKAKLLGAQFENENYGKLEKYNSLTCLGSDENKKSLFSMINDYLQMGCKNITLRVTIDKNDFELLIFEKSKKAALCFHDLSKQDVVHSCIIVSDPDMYINFYRLYQKLWNEDIILEIDFSLGVEHVKNQIAVLEKIDPVEKNDELAPLDNVIHEAEKKIEACKIVKSA